MTQKLTEVEQRAVDRLKRASSPWPSTLWIFSGAGTLSILKKLPNGERAMTPRGDVDQNYVVATLPIENDGGDW